LAEPIVQHGPFVMNTPEQIHQAMRDYHAGKFSAVSVQSL
jgi:redox-sensitive bicupin YhaK (pirin superfamily)